MREHRGRCRSPGPSSRSEEGERWLEQSADLRGLLRAAARPLERVEHPGQTVARERLFAAGWPGDKAKAASMTIRLRVAISNLRKLGLGSASRASRGGFLLDPNVDVSFA